MAGVYETRQAKRITDASTTELVIEAFRGALDDAGLGIEDVDGVAAEWSGPGGSTVMPSSSDWARQLGRPLSWISDAMPAGPFALVDAVAAIRDGRCSTVLIGGGQARVLPGPGRTVAAYTQLDNEFIGLWGATTPTEFALLARRHMDLYGTTAEQLATVATTIRNHGSINPNAVMYGRGPYDVDTVLDSPMVCSPFHLLELSLVSEGAAAIVLTDRIDELRSHPVFCLGGGSELRGNAYVNPPIYEEIGDMGEALADRVFSRAGLAREDIDVFQLYDPTVFEVIRQFEVLGYCKTGEGGPFVSDGRIRLGGSHPVNTDGGLLSHAHLKIQQMTQKVIEAVQQLRGLSGERQVVGARTALVTGGGPPAGFYSLVALGTETP